MPTPEELVRTHLANVGNPTPSDVYAENITVEFPYAPRHHTQRLEGKAAVLRYVARVAEFFAGYHIPDPKFLPSSDPNLVITEYAAKATNTETDLFYHQEYVAFITVTEGAITHIREYYDPIRVMVTFGEMDEPGAEPA